MKGALLILVTVVIVPQCKPEKTDLSQLEETLLLRLRDIAREQNQDNDFAKQIRDLQGKKDTTDTNVVTEEKCEDKDEKKCYALVLAGECARDEKNMRELCPQSCKFCCKDNWPKFACERARTFGVCEKSTERAQKNCAKTCGECGIRLPAPPACLSGSEFGCCWDRATARLLPLEYGDSPYDGCPECKDLDETMCKRFASDCEDRKRIKGQQIRNFCPKTCGLCGAHAKVRDYADEKACAMYKLQGLCQSSVKTMSFYCQRTCHLELGENKGCRDSQNLDCKLLARHNTCTDPKFKKRMEHLCPVSCGKCNNVE